MVRKIKAKAVLRLDGQGLSGRAMAGSPGIARQSVSETPGAAKTAGVGWDDVADRPDDEVHALLFPGRGERESVYERPDWARVHRELARVGVTLRIPHGEYVDGCRRAGKPYMGYDRFCRPYAAHVPELGVTSGVEHKAGRTVFLVKLVFRFRGGDEMLDSLGGEEPSLWRGIRESSVNVPWGCTSGTGTARRM